MRSQGDGVGVGRDDPPAASAGRPGAVVKLGRPISLCATEAGWLPAPGRTPGAAAGEEVTHPAGHFVAVAGRADRSFLRGRGERG